MENFEKKNLEFLTTFTCLVVNFFLTQKTYSMDKFLVSPSKFFLLKNIFKVSLQYLFNVFMLFNTVFNLKLLKIDQKMNILKKLGKSFENISGNPEIYSLLFCNFF